jgi:NADH dehydrogenase
MLARESLDRPEQTDPKVVIIGSGFAGYFAARRLQRRLRRTQVQVTTRATRVDLAARVVYYLDPLGEETEVPYDRLLLSPGSVTRLLDIAGLAEDGVGFKTVAEALYLRDHVLDRMEIANSTTDGVRRQAALTFVVVGAGYADTELTAQMARLTTNLLPFYPDRGSR